MASGHTKEVANGRYKKDLLFASISTHHPTTHNSFSNLHNKDFHLQQSIHPKTTTANMQFKIIAATITSVLAIGAAALPAAAPEAAPDALAAPEAAPEVRP